MNLCKKDVKKIVADIVKKYSLPALDEYKLENVITLLDENTDRALFVFEISDELKEVLEMYNYKVFYENGTGYRIIYNG